jgi:hypothetical protein
LRLLGGAIPFANRSLLHILSRIRKEEIANCNFGPQGEIDLAGGGTRSHRKIRSLKIGRKG